MILNLSQTKIIRRMLSCRFQRFSTEADVHTTFGPAPKTKYVISNIAPHWKTAISSSEIPGPSKWGFYLSFIPGGPNYHQSLMEVHRRLRERYGNVVRIPGQFGRRDLVLLFDPDDFERVFRTEGLYPVRQGLDSLEYYRKKVRNDFYNEFGGLVAEQGERWGFARKITSPVMMNPKTVKTYIPLIDSVVLDFIERIKKIRNSNNNEMPSDFELEINRWALESTGVIALDTRLGLLSNKANHPQAVRAIKAIKNFFQYIYEVDFKPSPWRYIQTPKFRKLLNTFAELHDITCEHINRKVRKMSENPPKKEDTKIQSVLEKLLQINPKIAHVVSMDMLLAGVDTTSASFVSCCFEIAKNQDKQATLRDEIFKVLPEKNSPLTIENMKNMPYLRACIKEALRLTPVLQANFRSAGQDLVLSGYQIPKGTNLCMSSILLLRDDKHFPNANKFLPERWLRDLDDRKEHPSAKLAHPFIYLPFGFGPRACIGKRFAELQIEVLLSRIVRNFYIEWNYPDIVFLPNFINVPTGNLQFKFTDVNK